MWNGDVTGMGKKLKGNACSAFVIIQLKKRHCISSHRGQHEKKIRNCLTSLLFENYLAKPAADTAFENHQKNVSPDLFKCLYLDARYCILYLYLDTFFGKYL